MYCWHQYVFAAHTSHKQPQRPWKGVVFHDESYQVDNMPHCLACYYSTAVLIIYQVYHTKYHIPPTAIVPCLQIDPVLKPADWNPNKCYARTRT